MSNQKSKDEFLKDTSGQNLADTLTDLKSLVTSIQAEVQALKTSSQTQDKTLITEQIRDDIGTAESFANQTVNQAARNFDNSKMNQADEKDVALTTKYDALNFGKQIKEHSDQYFNQLLSQRDQMFNAYITHVSSELSNERVAKSYQLSDERVQKDAMRTPEIQGGQAIGDE